MKPTTALKEMRNYRMPFGKYYGKGYLWVILNDPQYAKWVIENITGFTPVKKYFQKHLKFKILTIHELLKDMSCPTKEYEIYEVEEYWENEGHNPFYSFELEKCKKYIYNKCIEDVEYEFECGNIFYYETNKYLLLMRERRYHISGKFLKYHIKETCQ